MLFTERPAAIIIREKWPRFPNFVRWGAPHSTLAVPFAPIVCIERMPRGLSSGHRVHGAYAVGCIVCMQRMRRGVKSAFRVRRMHTIAQMYIPCTRSAASYVRGMHSIDGPTWLGRLIASRYGRRMHSIDGLTRTGRITAPRYVRGMHTIKGLQRPSGPVASSLGTFHAHDDYRGMEKG